MKCRVKGVPVNCESVGQGWPLLMRHGMPGDHRYMTHLAADTAPMAQLAEHYAFSFPVD